MSGGGVKDTIKQGGSGLWAVVAAVDVCVQRGLPSIPPALCAHATYPSGSGVCALSLGCLDAQC